MTKALRDRKFRWKTAEGDILTLEEMDTKHIFNCMKMCFNHLAENWGGTPVWFVQEYRDYRERAARTPEVLARCVVTFIVEIEKRGDLPERYRDPYQQILDQLRPRLIEAERAMLPIPTQALLES